MRILGSDPRLQPDSAVSQSDGAVPRRFRWSPARLLLPLPTDQLPRRFAQLIVGLVLYGVSMAMMIRGNLGVDPWDVFHLGVNRFARMDLGLLVIIVSAVVLLAWIPLKQKPGVGTLANVMIIGVAVSATMAVLPEQRNLAVRICLLSAGIVLNALAGALYIGAGLGPGARDGLMVGLVARGWGSIRFIRTCIEVSVLVIGWILSSVLWGGPAGPGTVAYALGVGPLLHWMLPRLTVCRRD